MAKFGSSVETLSVHSTLFSSSCQVCIIQAWAIKAVPFIPKNPVKSTPSHIKKKTIYSIAWKYWNIGYAALVLSPDISYSSDTVDVVNRVGSRTEVHHPPSGGSTTLHRSTRLVGEK